MPAPIPSVVSAGGGSSGSGDRTITITPSAIGQLVLVSAATSGNTNTAPTCSDDQGGTYKLVQAAFWGASANVHSVFIRDQLTSNTNLHTITVATGANTAGALTASCWGNGPTTGGLGAVRQSAKTENGAAAGTPSATFSQSTAGGGVTSVAAFVSNSSNPTGVTKPAPFLLQIDTGQNAPTTGEELATDALVSSFTTVTWGSTSATVWSTIIVELQSPVGGTSLFLPLLGVG